MTIEEFAVKLQENLRHQMLDDWHMMKNTTDEKSKELYRFKTNVYADCIIEIADLVQQAEQERTNFEKWRDDREPSDYVSQIIEWNYDSDSCTSCPFVGKQECPRIKHRDEYRCIEASECWEVLMGIKICNF